MAEVFVPEIASADPATWSSVEHLAVAALAARPATVRWQVLLFLRLLDLAAVARVGRRFHRLAMARRVAMLEALGRSPILALRRGIWGLRTLVFLGWYGQPAIQRAIGYRADPAGWDARR